MRDRPVSLLPAQAAPVEHDGPLVADCPAPICEWCGLPRDGQCADPWQHDRFDAGSESTWRRRYPS